MKIVEYDSSLVPPDANLFYSGRWMDVLGECYDFDFKIVVEDQSLLIFAEIHDVYGSRVISMPFSDYTEPYVASEDQLVAVANLLADAYPSSAIVLKLHGQYSGLASSGFENIRQAYCHRVDLRGGEDAVWERTDRHFKKGVRKARDSQVTVRTVNSEDGVTVFYDMLTALRRKKFGILPQSKGFYSLLYERFVRQGHGNIWVASHNGEAIASAFVLHSGTMMFDKMGVSDPSHLEVRPNNLLLWEIMRYGIKNGLSHLDMGLSGVDYEGLIRFKDSLGGQRSPINFYRRLPPGHDSKRDAEIKKLFSSMTHFLVDSTLGETELQRAAEFLYKYFC